MTEDRSASWDDTEESLDDDVSDLLAPGFGTVPTPAVIGPPALAQPDPVDLLAPPVVALSGPPAVGPGRPTAASPAGVAAPGGRAAGVGTRFHPLAGTPLAMPLEANPMTAVLAAPTGSPVHAVCSGRCTPEGADGVRLTGKGLEVGYHAVRAAGPSEVRAGAVIGTLVGRADGPVAGYARLLLDVRSAEGDRLDAVSLLVGLADPAELGLAVGGELGLDPDSLDREIGLSGPTPP